MKTKLYLLIILISCLSITSKAQLRVLQNGRVQVGTLRLDGEDPLYESTCERSRYNF